MIGFVRARWQTAGNSLWFVPGLLVLLLAALAIVAIRLDDAYELQQPFLFDAKADAARQVLAVIAASLITIAGVTLSVTIVVLQLVSSQFSPRVLRNFLADRVVQVTAGTFVGIFVYCLLVLRALPGTDAAEEAVPKLSVTLGVVLGVAGLGLLLAFIHHIAQLVQVSNLAASIWRDTMRALDRVYAADEGGPVEGDVDVLVEEWEAEALPILVFPDKVGYVQKIALEEVADEIRGRGVRLAIKARPGDFVMQKTPLAAVWADADDPAEIERAVRHVVVVTGERDFAQDAGFGIRQLADIAIKAMSPSINDPTTAVTAVGYVGAILARIAERPLPAFVRRFSDSGTTVVLRPTHLREYLDAFTQIALYASKDARVIRSELQALATIGETAVAAGMDDHAAAVADVAARVAELGIEDARLEHDRAALEALADEVTRRSRA